MPSQGTGRAGQWASGQDVEVETDADIETVREKCAQPRPGIVEARHIHHERRRRDDAVLDGFDDAAIHARNHAEVVGVDQQALRHVPASDG